MSPTVPLSKPYDEYAEDYLRRKTMTEDALKEDQEDLTDYAIAEYDRVIEMIKTESLETPGALLGRAAVWCAMADVWLSESPSMKPPYENLKKLIAEKFPKESKK